MMREYRPAVCISKDKTLFITNTLYRGEKEAKEDLGDIYLMMTPRLYAIHYEEPDQPKPLPPEAPRRVIPENTQKELWTNPPSRWKPKGNDPGDSNQT